jgi:hypothetical protein
MQERLVAERPTRALDVFLALGSSGSKPSFTRLFSQGCDAGMLSVAWLRFLELYSILAQPGGRNGLGADKQVSVSTIKKEQMKHSVGVLRPAQRTQARRVGDFGVADPKWWYEIFDTISFFRSAGSPYRKPKVADVTARIG